MLINSLPNAAISFKAERPIPERNLVLHATSHKKYYYPGHATPYMLIVNLNSRGRYVVNDQKLSLGGQNFLFLNANDKLSISYDNDPVESLFILFEDNFVDQTYLAFSTDCNIMLDRPFEIGADRESLHSIPLKIDREILLLFNSIKRLQPDQNDLDEKLIYLMKKVVQLESRRSIDICKIQAVKRSTKIELYRRLLLARDYMESNLTQTRLTVDEIARFAGLNKFHFILNFNSLFGNTPHQYLVNIKLKKAFELIQSTNYSVTEACYLSGFESLPSFSILFKKKFGVAPSMLIKGSRLSIKSYIARSGNWNQH